MIELAPVVLLGIVLSLAVSIVDHVTEEGTFEKKVRREMEKERQSLIREGGGHDDVDDEENR